MIEASTCLEMDIHNRLKTPVGDQERLERLLSSALLEETSMPSEIGGVLALQDSKMQQLMLTVVSFKRLKRCSNFLKLSIRLPYL